MADASTPDSGAPLGCLAPTAGPTVHPAATITASETWTADKSPHVVSGEFSVRAPAILTIEPCAEVRLAEGAALTVNRGGILVAKGDANRRITFVQKDAGRRWTSIDISDPARADLAYVSISGGGGAVNSTAGTSVRARGTNVVPIVTPLKVDHVTVRDSPGPGVILSETAGFAEGSQDLVITETGKSPQNNALSGPYPLRLNLNALGTIPTGTYTGNGKDEIWLVGDAPTSALTSDATLRNRGVPYHVGGFGSNTELRIAKEMGQATLTIEAGVEIRMERGASFQVGHFTGDVPPVGVLIAVGTAGSPIVLTSASATPQAGDWVGLSYATTLSPNNRLEYVTVRYAGAACGCSGFTCGPTLRPGVTDEAAIILFNTAPSAFIKNTAIENSAAHGISRGWRGDSTPSFLADGTNTFSNVAGCKETFPKDRNGGCPSQPPCPR